MVHALIHTRQTLLTLLAERQIPQKTVEHRPVFTVEEGRDLKATMPGGHSKNLFLKDKKGSFFLAIAHADTKVDLAGLGKTIGAKGRLSFGKPEAMEEILAVSPGSVTPFAIINDHDRRIHQLILDTHLMAHDPIWFHPLENTASTAISPEGLMQFFALCNVTPVLMNLAQPGTPGP